MHAELTRRVDQAEAASPAAPAEKPCLNTLRLLRADLHGLQPGIPRVPMTDPAPWFSGEFARIVKEVHEAIPDVHSKAHEIFDRQPAPEPFATFPNPYQKDLDRRVTNLDSVISYISARQGLRLS
jgi:hypothetical protein